MSQNGVVVNGAMIRSASFASIDEPAPLRGAKLRDVVRGRVTRAIRNVRGEINCSDDTDKKKAEIYVLLIDERSR